MSYRLSPTDFINFNKDGYIIIKNFFNTREIEKLYTIAIQDSVVKNNSSNVTDSTGKSSKLTLWFTPGEDVYSMMLRSERMVNAASILLDSDTPVCHFHTKLMQK